MLPRSSWRSACTGSSVSGARIPLAPTDCSSTAASRFATPIPSSTTCDTLGITDCYASSYLKAVPGSPHGYDVADPTRLNPDLGTDGEYWTWIDALRARGHGPRPRSGAEPHGHRQARRTRGGRMCSKTDRARASRASSTSNGIRSRTSWRTRCSFRPSAISTERSSSARNCRSSIGTARSRSRYGNATFPLAPDTYPAILGLDVEALPAGLERRGATSSRASSPPPEPPAADDARPAGDCDAGAGKGDRQAPPRRAGRVERDGARPISTAWSPASMARRVSRAASTCSIGC